MSAPDPLFDYAAEVLAFDYADAAPADIPPPPEAEVLHRLAGRCAAALARSGKARLSLLGLGSGTLAQALAETLPAGTLCVCEQDLALVRGLQGSGRLDWWSRGGAASLALDASPWAVLLLLDRAGLDMQDALVLPNPELPPGAKARLRPLELLLTRSKLLDLPAEPPLGALLPKLSAAAILSPSEPDLPEFFAQFPDWLHELVLVWDAEAVPDIPVPGGLRVRQAARRLDRDFAAQRQAMIAGCGGDFVFYLDADERLSPQAWAALPQLCAMPGLEAWHFPRLTPYPDAGHLLTGFGLWPDIQLRLFRRLGGLCFVNPVHERLTGLTGCQALALDVEIEHLSRLRKDVDELRRKLAGFDAAGQGRVRHALSAEYPSVPRGLVASRHAGRPRCLLLPLEQSRPEIPGP